MRSNRRVSAENNVISPKYNKKTTKQETISTFQSQTNFKKATMPASINCKQVSEKSTYRVSEPLITQSDEYAVNQVNLIVERLKTDMMSPQNNQ